MENFNNIYKASELIKLVPELAPHIETEDWIHVAISHDPITHNTCLISFVWDTRDIVRCGLYADEESGIELLHSNHENFFKPAITNDNHTWLKIRNREDLKFFDYIADVNHEVMNVPTKLKLSKVQTGVNCNKYCINGKTICDTAKGSDYYCSMSKDGVPSNICDKVGTTYKTNWHYITMSEIFGCMPTNFYKDNFKCSYPNLTWGYKGHCASAKEVKETIMRNFNVIF